MSDVQPFNLGDDDDEAPATSYFTSGSDSTEFNTAAEPEDAIIAGASDSGDFGGDGIDLDFGGIDSITGYVPVPTGAYVIEFVSASISLTKDKTGQNVEVTMRVGDGPLAGRHIGKDFWYVPNKKVQDPKKYATTAGFFKGRLEAIYGREIDGQFRFNVKELPGMRCKGIVTLVDEGYGPQNKISSYLSMDTDLSNVVLPQPTQPRARKGDNGGGDTGDGSPRRFTI